MDTLMDEPRRWHHWLRPVSGLAILLGILPAMMAWACSPAISPARPLERHNSLPSLVFRQYSVNLREVPANGKIAVPFSFWNRGNGPLHIEKLEPSCGCLVPKLLGDRDEYVSGAQGLFEVHLETDREEPGPHTYGIVVHYNDGQPRTESLTFRMQVPDRAVRVEPTELYFYQLSETDLENEIRVLARPERNYTVTRAVSSSPLLKVTIRPQEPAGEELATPVQVAVAGKLPAGGQTVSVTIYTDDPALPPLKVPVFLHGRPASAAVSGGILPTSGSTLRSRAPVKKAEATEPGQAPDRAR